MTPQSPDRRRDEARAFADMETVQGKKTTMATPVETELKFEIDAAAARDLLAHPRLAGGGVEIQLLVARYFDTPTEALRRAGASLRLRDGEGEGRVQTVKFAGGETTGLFSRSEETVEVAASARRPDLARFEEETAARLAAIVGEEPLELQFTVRVERRIVAEKTADGSLVEIGVDSGKVTAGRRSHAFHEIEFELKGGDARALFALAADLVPPVGGRLGTGSKSSLGYRVKQGAEALAPQAVKASEPDLSGDVTVEAALRACLRSCIAQVAANIPVCLFTDAPEGPHQLRVGLRRLRTVLSAFEPVMAPGAAEALGEEAKWLADEVGALRDADVLADEIVAPLAGRVGLAGPLAKLADLRDERRTALRETLGGPRACRFVIDLLAFAECRGWLSSTDLTQSERLIAPLEGFAREAVDHRRKKIDKLAHRLDDLDAEERHDLRKSFKKMRYLLEFFAPLLPGKKAKALVSRTKKAQDLLGYLNDTVMAHRLPGLVGEGASVADLTALGYVIGWHEAKAEDAWERTKALFEDD